MSVSGFGVKFVEYGRKRNTAVCSRLFEMFCGKDLRFLFFRGEDRSANLRLQLKDKEGEILGLILQSATFPHQHGCTSSPQVPSEK